MNILPNKNDKVKFIYNGNIREGIVFEVNDKNIMIKKVKGGWGQVHTYSWSKIKEFKILQ
jgi:hypothetical protein